MLMKKKHFQGEDRPLRMLLWAVLIVGGLSVVAGCSKADPGEVAARSAKQYYDYLLEGKYEAFVDGRYQPEAIPESYRAKLVSLSKMYVSQMDVEHRGLKETRIVSVKADTARHEANVFLVFCFGDSTSEEVCVPMVEHQGLWYLR